MPSEAFRTWKQHLLLTGDLHPVALGWTREQVRSFFGEPDDVGAAWHPDEQPRIWRYETLELHFDPDRDWTLFLVYEDNEHGVLISIGEGTAQHQVPRSR